MNESKVRFVERLQGWLPLVTAVVLGLAQSAEARGWRPGQIPNGYSLNCAACHVDPNGGGARNSFGQAVEAELVRLYSSASNNPAPFWSATLALLDSDGDGYLNGKELGDPTGTWKAGDPAPSGPVTNPGDPASHPVNVPPSVTLTLPVNGASFTNPASVTLEATATDSDGTVSRVDFYDGTALLGSTTTSPYRVTTTLTLLGLHALAAVALDDGGATSTSAVATVTVYSSGNTGPGVTETFSFNNVNKPVPDGSPAGMSDRQNISSAISQITALQVSVAIRGEFNGDLFGYLRHVDGGVTNFCILLNRPGRTPGEPDGYSDAGLEVTFDDAASDIHTYRALLTPPAWTPLTGLWRPDGRAVDPYTVLDSSPATSSLASFNGADANGEWTLYLADLHSGGTNQLANWRLQITGRATPALTWPQPADIVYGTTLGPAQLNASASVPGTFAYSPVPGTVLNAGLAQTLSLTFTPADTNTFVPVTRTVNLNVLPRDLTITAVSATKAYGAPLPALNATYTGFVNGDSIVSLTAPANITTTAAASSPVGTYPITVSGAAASNYTITFVPATLTITPITVTGLVTSSAHSARPGQTVTFSFRATPNPPGASMPPGTVQFRVDGVAVGAPSPLVAGVASLSLATLSHGLHTVIAEYAGNGNFRGTTNSLAPVQLINTPPVALADTVTRSLANGTKVLLSKLLANDQDPDGDPLQLVSLSAGANGGAVTLDGDWVKYTPPAGFTNQDSFSYTIADSYGAQASGTVLVTLAEDAVPAPNLQITDLGNGSFVLLFDAIPFKTYRIEYTVDVALRSGWKPLGSGTADAIGIFTLIDTPPAGTPKRFYRSLYP